MRCRCVTAFAASLLVLPAPAGALDAGNSYLRVGAGIDHCDLYVAAYGYQPAEEAGYANWLAGYLTAINKALPDTYDIKHPLDLHGVMDWLLDYCGREEHVNHTVADALAQFVKIRYPHRRVKR